MSDRILTFPIRSDRLSMNVAVTQTLASTTSEFQQIDIVETSEFGRALLLDNHIQLTTFDEAAYHEALVQIPLLNIPNPKSALIVGGGDGGVLREITKHKSITKIDMVEIDQMVIDLCQEHLPTLSNNAYQDPRLNLMVEDAFAFLKYSKELYDLIVIDATDVYEEEEGELSENLFTQDFYQDCKKHLSPNGILVTQADNLVFCPYSLQAILNDFKKVFPTTGSYWSLVPSFGGFSGFAYASHSQTLSPVLPTESPSIPLSYLTPLTYQLALSKPPF